jgi:hypothetical protein
MYMVAVIVLAVALLGIVVGVGWISNWEDHLREDHRGEM